MPADIKSLKQDLTRRMDGAIYLLKKEFQGLRTSRPSPALLEPVRVEAYGGEVPLSQVANDAQRPPRRRPRRAQKRDGYLLSYTPSCFHTCRTSSTCRCAPK